MAMAPDSDGQSSSMEVASLADAFSVKIASDPAYICSVCKCLLDNPMQVNHASVPKWEHCSLIVSYDVFTIIDTQKRSLTGNITPRVTLH